VTTQQLAQHRTKAFLPVRFKAEGEDAGDGTKLGPGEFIALAAVFGNIDSYGDRIVEGAFTETLDLWAASGDPIPVIWQHNWGDPNAHIGHVLEAKETTEGLLYKGKLDIEPELENPLARQVYRLMKGRRVTQQSFGFDVIDGRSVTEEGRDVFEITRVWLYEVGPCLVGVNQATNLLDIKSLPSGADSTDSAPAPADAATSGQAASSANEPASAPSGSNPEPSSASKGISPASALLLVEELDLEGED
jgi:HK97 family phage prohead protease